MGYGILHNPDLEAAKAASAGAEQYSVEDRELLGKVEDRANNEALFGLKYEVMRNGLLNLAYYNGYQDTYWDEKNKKLSRAPARRGQHRIIDNKIMPACQHASNILGNQLSFTCRPESADFQARAQARLGERALKSQYRRLRWARKLRQMTKWQVTTGAGFVRPFFNPHAGPEQEFFMDPNSQQPIPEEMLTENDMEILRREGLSKKFREGDVDISVHSLFDLYVPDTTTDTDDMQWYVLTYRKSLGWIRQRFPKRGKMVASESFTAWERSSFEARILSMASGNQGASANSAQTGGLNYDDDKSAVLKIYVEPPSPMNPKGKFAAVANGVLLEKGDAPSHTFGLEGPDLFKFDMIDRPGSFWPMGLPEQMISPQRELNASRSQMSELRSQILRPRVLAPRGSNLNKSAYAPGMDVEIVEYNPDKGQPHFEAGRDIPSTLFANADLSIQSMRDLSAQHEAMQGQNPAGGRSGYMITQLQEKDLSFYRPIVESNAESFERLWSACLTMIAKTWKSERWIEETAGTELVWDGWVSGKDMAKRPRVKVDPESLMPQSKAAKQAFGEALLQYGPNLAMLPPMVRGGILDLMEIGDDTNIRDVHHQDVRRCEAMIERIIGTEEQPGVDVPARPGIDDHAAYSQVIANFMKSRQWESIGPEAQYRVTQFFQSHSQLLIQSLMAEGAASGGAPTSEPNQNQRQEAVNS